MPERAEREGAGATDTEGLPLFSPEGTRSGGDGEGGT